jgi:hypothetical protein
MPDDETGLATVKLHFVHRSVFNKASALPRLEDLRDNEKLSKDFDAALLDKPFSLIARDMRQFMIVSHRWVDLHHPDKSEEQRRLISEHLAGHPEKEWVWVDFCSLPQERRNSNGELLKEKTSFEKMYFQDILSIISIAYLLLDVLIIYDQDYTTRFWCMYETFLAMHSVHRGKIKTLDRAQAEERFTIVYAGSLADAKSNVRKQHAELLWAQWGQISTVDAIKQLDLLSIRIVSEKATKWRPCTRSLLIKAVDTGIQR